MSLIGFQEQLDSRSSTSWPPSYSTKWLAWGEKNDVIVRAYASASTPALVSFEGQFLNRTNITLTPDGHARYLISVEYSKKNNEVGSAQFSFDTTGATIHVTAAKEHIASYPSGGDDNPHKGSIGVELDGRVGGADIIAPALKLMYTFRHPHGQVDEAFSRMIAHATGRVNSDTFRGFQAGELLFAGGSGRQGTDSDAEVTYNFIAASNDDGLTVGDITGISKGGHHNAWVEFEEKEDADGRASTRPRRVHIERVYDDIAFADVFGWS